MMAGAKPCFDLRGGSSNVITAVIIVVDPDLVEPDLAVVIVVAVETAAHTTIGRIGVAIGTGASDTATVVNHRIVDETREILSHLDATRRTEGC